MKNNVALGLLTLGLFSVVGSANALATVPEPSSLSLLGLALIITGLISRKK